MKKYLKVVLVPLIFLIVFPLILSIINLFDVEIPKIIYLISVMIMTLITGIFLGLITSKKAYLKGIALGSSMSLLMFLLSIILKAKYSIYSLIYYLIIIVAATLGTIIGITKKR